MLAIVMHPDHEPYRLEESRQKLFGGSGEVHHQMRQRVEQRQVLSRRPRRLGLIRPIEFLDGCQ
ncbi:hypothetical protein ACPZ19_45890 [Amycolatopsis lurida]